MVKRSYMYVKKPHATRLMPGWHHHIGSAASLWCTNACNAGPALCLHWTEMKSPIFQVSGLAPGRHRYFCVLMDNMRDGSILLASHCLTLSHSRSRLRLINLLVQTEQCRGKTWSLQQRSVNFATSSAAAPLLVGMGGGGGGWCKDDTLRQCCSIVGTTIKKLWIDVQCSLGHCVGVGHDEWRTQAEIGFSNKSSPWIWKGVSATSWSGRYTLSYPRGRNVFTAGRGFGISYHQTMRWRVGWTRCTAQVNHYASDGGCG